MNTDLKSLLLTYDGRINRQKFWIAVAVYVALTVVLGLFVSVVAGVSFMDLAYGAMPAFTGGVTAALTIVFLVYVAMSVSGIFVGIKRLHDRDKSGWWILLFYAVPMVLNATGSPILSFVSLAISVWMFVELGCLKGTAGPNRFGPDPLAA